jgi:hypothetical protein
MLELRECNMAKSMSGEIDTVFEEAEGKAATNTAERVKSLSADISLDSELKSDRAELSEAAAFPEKIFYYSVFPRKVYCTLSGIRLRLVQTGEGGRLSNLHPGLQQQAERCGLGRRLGIQLHAV